jgi:hypothetical protein
MWQIYNAVFETVFQAGDKHGPLVALVVLAVVGCGLVLLLISQALRGN